jgi:hypothetical protein
MALKLKENERKKENKQKIDVHTHESKKTGLRGLIEVQLRKHKAAGLLFFLIPIIFSYIGALTLALFPSIYTMMALWEWSIDWPFIGRALCLSCGLGLSFFMAIIGVILSVPLFNWILLRLSGPVKPLRVIGHSLDSLPWYYHNAMTQLARYTVLDFITTTPLLVLFYRLMGMNIGKGVVINSSNISDPCLITLEDHVIIGGSATVFAHYGMHGYLIISETIIKKGTTIGLKASVMGNVIVGENQTIAPGETLLPKTRIPDKKRGA